MTEIEIEFLRRLAEDIDDRLPITDQSVLRAISILIKNSLPKNYLGFEKGSL